MESSEYMLQLHKQLMEERKVGETTANAYIRALYQLNGRKPFKNLGFLKKVTEIEDRIKDYAESTQKTILATIVSVLTLFKAKPGFKKTYEAYLERMDGKAKAARETDDKHVKTEKQSENWLTWEEVLKTRTDLAKQVDAFATNKTVTPVQFETLLRYVVLSLYTDIPPRRNQDYLKMVVVSKHTDKSPTDRNYLDMDSKKMYFHVYKTSKKYGTQVIDVPDTLLDAVRLLLRFHPARRGSRARSYEVKLLVNADGTPITAQNAITRMLNRTFGKKIGSSMLRHIFLSDKYKGIMEEQASDAEAMGHSLGLQREYYKKDDAASDSDAEDGTIKHA
jgi:integrase